MKRAIAGLAMQLIAAALCAQTAEYSRASGGDIDLITKHPQRLSGSLGIGTGKTFDLNLGGTLVKDRVWFFASAERGNAIFGSDVRLNAQAGDKQTVAVSALQMKSPAIAPASFLSLHYTGIISPNSFFTANFSELKR